MNNRYAITFGEVAILHIGGKEYGKGRLEHGFTTTELKKIAEENTDTEYISISDKLPRKLRTGNDAGILIFRSVLNKKNNKDKKYVLGLTKKEADKLYLEQETVEYDQKYWDNRRLKRLKLVLGNKTKKLNAEGNKYFHDKAGIGYHGDAERKIVICLSLGKPTTLRYHWRLPGSSDHKLEPTDINLNHGDVYIMSEKATGYDWKSRSKVRVVHGAGKNYI